MNPTIAIIATEPPDKPGFWVIRDGRRLGHSATLEGAELLRKVEIAKLPTPLETVSPQVATAENAAQVAEVDDASHGFDDASVPSF